MEIYLIIERVKIFMIGLYKEIFQDGENRFIYITELGDDKFRSSASFWGALVMSVLAFLIMMFAADKKGDDGYGKLFSLSWWINKTLHTLPVVLFSAAVFAIHIFYKTIGTAITAFFDDEMSGVMLQCLGSYINPISVCAYSILVAKDRNGSGPLRAGFMGLSLFMVPALISYFPEKMEIFSIYGTAIAIALVGALIYEHMPVHISYVILSLTYLVGKYFMILYSESVAIMDRHSSALAFKQYLSAMRIDFAMIAVLTLVLLIYHVVDEVNRKNEAIAGGLIVAALAALFVTSVVMRSSNEINTVVYAREGYGAKKVRKVDSLTAPVTGDPSTASSVADIPQEKVTVKGAEASTKLTASSGVTYDINFTYDGNMTTCWQDGEADDGIGATLSYSFDEANVSKLVVYNGNRRDGSSYESNNRLKTVTLCFYQNGEEVNSMDYTFKDEKDGSDEITFGGGITCDGIVMKVNEVYSGTSFKDTCVAEVEIYRYAQ